MILEKIISRIPNGLKYFGIIIVGLVILWLSVILYTGLPNPFYVAATPELLPNIQIGDLLLARGTDGGISIDSLRLGDVIIYHAPANYDRIVVSRIIQIQTDSRRTYIKNSS